MPILALHRCPRVRCQCTYDLLARREISTPFVVKVRDNRVLNVLFNKRNYLTQIIMTTVIFKYLFLWQNAVLQYEVRFFCDYLGLY